MYNDFYNFSKEPFKVTPDPAFFFLSPTHKEALATIIYGVEQRKGFITITGEVGLGKTTVLRSYLEKIDLKQLRVAYIFNTNVSFRFLLKTVFREMEIEGETDSTFEMVATFNRFLIDEYKKGHNVVLVIDEAQNVPTRTLESLRMLSNLETTEDKLIQIVLVGQPDLQARLEEKNLRQLNQRIAVRQTLLPLTNAEGLSYIRHRLGKVASKDAMVFTEGALKKVVRHAKGNPRMINILCDNALVAGYALNRKPVIAKIVKQVIRDFEGKSKLPLGSGIRTLIGALAIVIVLICCWFSLYTNKPFSSHARSLYPLFTAVLSSIEQRSEVSADSNNNSANKYKKTINVLRREIPKLPGYSESITRAPEQIMGARKSQKAN